VAEAVVIQAKRSHPGLDVVARASERASLDRLRSLGVLEIVLPEFEAGLEMTRQAMHHLRIRPEDIQSYADAARSDLHADGPGAASRRPV